MVPRIPKRYHMWGYNNKIPIKMTQILQIASFWTFWTFLIILMMTKKPGNTSWALPWSQGFQKGIICRVTMTKSQSRFPKSSKSRFFFFIFWTFLINLMATKNPENTSWELPWSQGFQKGIICGGYRGENKIVLMNPHSKALCTRRSSSGQAGNCSFAWGKSEILQL